MLKPSACNGCALQKFSTSFSIPEGLCTNGVLIMGEALGHNEAIDGLPFRERGAAGSLLEQAFRITRTNRTQYLIDNIVRCQPPNDNLTGYGYEHDAIQHCTDVYSNRVFGDSRVRVVLALGAVAFRNISGLAGKKLGVGECRGYVVHNGLYHGLPIIGSYHPAHIRRGKLAYTDYLCHDLRKALGVANGSYKNFCSVDRYPAKYQLNPTTDEARSYYYYVRDNPNLDLAYDIETPNSAEAEEDERDELTGAEILSIQFSTGKGKGIYMPWEGNYIKVAKALLRLANRKLCFNGYHFDNPKLYSNGCVIRGKIVDLMWFWHHLKPDLEMGLQKVASMCDFPFLWKHFAMDQRMQRFYGCVDVDVLHWVFPKLDGIMKGLRVPSYD